MLLCTQAFALQTSLNLCLVISPGFAHTSHPFCEIPYALQPHKPTIVLPDFTRSCFAVKE